MRPPSFTNKMQDNLPPMRRTPMLEQINTLPGPQSEVALQDRHWELHAGRRRADVCGHVVGAFVCVPILAGVLRRQAIEKCLQIAANVRRGVLLYEQSGGGMSAK